ncbi:carbohydrate binding domain-containing protein [Streptomyces sp. NPDC056723]|uniref:carbohydrate binding domain-containing protein n=1 Tax=Streptomyces sp. NPDC056723 TaxID=3345925 RepID=UPI0036C4793E
MPQGDYGDLKVGRLLLRETFKAGESVGTERTFDLEGQESSPPLTRTDLVWRHDNLLALEAGCVHPLTFTDKPERNCYVNLNSASADYTEWRGEVVTSDWKLGMTRLGSDAEIDLQSRLTGVARVNDFSLSGERWHAPPIGHYGYQTGNTSPSTMSRTGGDGAMTVYRGIPAGVSPRWGCLPTAYLNGRVRLTSNGTELCGVDQALAPTGWALGNGLVNVAPGASASLDVQTYTGGAWRSKLWNVSVAGSAASITGWDGATLLRNDCEQVILRLTKGLNPGRATLDLTLRRGSRTVEGYLQTSTSNTLAVYRSTLEANTSFAASGYVTAAGDDVDGNQFAIGSARAFTTHPNGGIQKSAATSMDFWIGAVLSGAGGGTLNANPTFDVDASAWSGASSTVARSTAVMHPQGIASLLVTPAGGVSAVSARSDLTAVGTVTPGQQYRVSGWFYSPGGWSVMYPSAQWADASGAVLSSSFSSRSVPAGQWTYLEDTVTAPASSSRARMAARADSTPSTSDIYYAWNLRIRPPVASGDTATDLRNQYIAAMPETIYGVRR